MRGLKKEDVLEIVGEHWINLYSIVMHLVRDGKTVSNRKGELSVRSTLTAIKRHLSLFVEKRVIERCVTGNENMNSTYYRRIGADKCQST